MNGINGLHIAVLVTSGMIIIILLIFLLRSGNTEGSSGQRKQPDSSPSGAPVKKRHCPLCGEPLNPGETVHSVFYPGKPDSLMEIFGCPHCEKPGSKNHRRCPVCKKIMPDDGCLIARVFEKPGKKHVHVLGCNICYRGPSNTKRPT